MTDHSARAVLDAFIRQTVFAKLAGTLPDDGMIWMNITDVVRHVDPEEFNRSKYSKYTLAEKLKHQLQALEDQCFITTRGSRYAIHEVFLMFVASQPKEVVDAYVRNHMKDPYG
jgi:hypothetical protein